MKDLVQRIEDQARERGCDVFGVAPIERFEHAPDEFHPRIYLSTAKSVVVAGVKIVRGLTHVQRRQVAYLPYDMFGHAWLGNVAANLIALEVARILEDEGHLAVPLPATPCEESWTTTEDNEGWVGEQFIAYPPTAVAAGLGELGWHGMLLSPRYGPRQRLVVVITSAKLPASPMFEGQLCDPEDCGYRCVEACPVGAIEPEQGREIQVGDRSYDCGGFEGMRCLWATAGLSPKTCKFAPLELEVPENLDPKTYMANKRMFHSLSPGYDKYKFAFSKSAFCADCLAACCDYLEESGKVENRFPAES